MVAGCSATCVKYLFFTFNFLIFISGCSILGVSLWARFDNNFRQTIEDVLKSTKVDYQVPELDKLQIALYILAALGAMLLICGFLGCCGACCESTCLLGLFVLIMLLLFFVEMAGGIYILVKKGDIKKDITSIVTAFYSQENEEVRKSREDMEDALKCCGIDGCVGDLLKSLTVNSCCQRFSKLMPGIVRPGCADVIYDQLKNNFTVVALVVVCLAVLEILAMLFACFLCSAIRNSAYSYY